MRARTIRQSRLNPAQQSSWSSNASRTVKRAVIEFLSVSFSQMILLERLSVLYFPIFRVPEYSELPICVGIGSYEFRSVGCAARNIPVYQFDPGGRRVG